MKTTDLSPAIYRAEGGLARFQSVPDSYVLPEKASLACRVIGNGVPCLMFEKLYRGLTEGAT